MLTNFTVRPLIVLAFILMAAPILAQNGELYENYYSITFGAIFPHSSYTTRIREYRKQTTVAINDFQRTLHPGDSFKNILKNITFETVNWPVTPSPMLILNSLCQVLLPKKVTAILYASNSELYSSDTAATQYFLQLANYLGIPVLAWNAANSGLEKKLPNSVVLQLAPTVAHQASAMMSILERYNWKRFSVVTTRIAGHNDFLEAIRKNIFLKNYICNFELLSVVQIDSTTNDQYIQAKLNVLMETDSRVFLLYSTRDDAKAIFKVAQEMNLTNTSFIWIVTQSIVSHSSITYSTYQHYPVGILGIAFDTSDQGVLNFLGNATKIVASALEVFVKNSANWNTSLKSNCSCSILGESSRWQGGINFYEYLRNVSFETTSKIKSLANKPDIIEFNPDGTLKYTTLNVVNLNEHHQWTQVGVWQDDVLYLRDLVWPGNSPFPPLGRPDKFHLKVTFLEEPPYFYMDLPDNVTNKCWDESVICRIPTVNDGIGYSGVDGNETSFRCCSGMCVDILKKLSADLDFTFDLKRVEDGLWGSRGKNGSWNGLVAELLNRKADMVMTSLKINSERESVVDFSVPFMQTGIAIVVAKRTGIISPKAFLEPFDPISWFFILVVCIQASALTIFIFEWLSPSGFDKKFRQPKGHNFSLFRTYWLVWAMLFAASVNLTSPRGYTARFMANIWAGFTKVFLAIYTANLAAFMITSEEYYQFSGVEDLRLTRPLEYSPPLKFGTIPYGNTDAILKSNFVNMHRYMQQYNRSSVREGIQAVKTRQLDAFIYDATVLDYLVGEDDECKLLTVGEWYAMTGYGIAFPRNSKYIHMIDQKLLTYGSQGLLEQWQNYWLAGACKPSKENQLKGYTYISISLNQFMSAFVLLGSGILLSFVLLILEKVYFKYLRKPLAQKKNSGCCTLVSMNLGKSLTFKQAVLEAQDAFKTHKCEDPICDMLLWKARRELDMATIKLAYLQNEIKTAKTSKEDNRWL